MDNTAKQSWKEKDWRNERAPFVKGVFDSVASRYDVMNDLMSMGVHRLWKREMVEILSPKAGESILDLAGGTGDIAVRAFDFASARSGGNVQPKPVMVSDINDNMLACGRDRAIDNGDSAKLEWLCCDAKNLPLEGASFDACTMAFGIRNVENRDEALREIFRVLKVGGRFVCMEFGKIERGMIAKIYNSYSDNVIPKIGKLVAGDEESYRYLVESIRDFPAAEDFRKSMLACGFDRVNVKKLSAGIVNIYHAWKL